METHHIAVRGARVQGRKVLVNVAALDVFTPRHDRGQLRRRVVVELVPQLGTSRAAAFSKNAGSFE